MNSDPRVPAKCRSCRADVLWVITSTGKKMPVDAVPDLRPLPQGGDFFLTYNRERQELKAEKYKPSIHSEKLPDGSYRNRYTSHFRTCVNADQHRKG